MWSHVSAGYFPTPEAPAPNPKHRYGQYLFDAAGDISGSIDVLERARRLTTLDSSLESDVLAQLGTALHRRGGEGDWGRAEHCYRASLALRPRAFQPLCNLGTLLASKGDISRALRVYQRIHLQYPADAPSASNFAALIDPLGLVSGSFPPMSGGQRVDMRETSKRLAMAKRLYSRALLHDEGCVMALVGLAGIAWREGNRADAHKLMARLNAAGVGGGEWSAMGGEEALESCSVHARARSSRSRGAAGGALRGVVLFSGAEVRDQMGPWTTNTAHSASRYS